jgi:hypothetical protein
MVALIIQLPDLLQGKNVSLLKNKASVVLATLMVVCTPAQAASGEKPTESASFEGVWSKKWCDKSQPDRECGGFTAILIQNGDRLCGRFSAARPGLTQVDEGNPQSVRGVVIEGAAVVAAMSGRNEGTYLVRLDRKGKDLRWHLLEQVGAPDNGDIQLIALDDTLVRHNGSAEREQLSNVKAECVAK